jgi:hypothetical protein
MSRLRWHVCLVPEAEVGLFDYLIGASEQRQRQFKTEGFCRLKVMDQVEFGRLFNWNVGRLRAS